MTTSVTFDRTSLSLSDLVVGLYAADATYFLPPEGITRPAFTMRRTYAPDGDITGKQLLQAVQDSGPVQLSIYAQATSTSALTTAMEALDAAATQWSYDLTVTVDGVARTYPADPEFPQWGLVDAGLVGVFLALATITVPVNPVEA